MDNKIELFEHQKLARKKFEELNEIALFFEMGCGKTLTSTVIMCDKYNKGLIDALLVVAPNDVHKQWYDDLCNEDSVLYAAVKEAGVETDIQIFGGRGGQKAIRDFKEGCLNILCVNIDTFSTPHKWECIVNWANEHKTAIIVDEATVIKSPSSKRSQRLLYEFNNVQRRGKVIIKNEKINPVRAVLTGTPVTNGPMDLWAIMEFIKPGFFGRNYYSFMSYYGMHTKLSLQDRVINVLLTEKTWQGIKSCEDYSTAFNLFGCSLDTYLTVKSQDKFSGPFKHAEELRAMLEPNAVFAKLVDCVDMPNTNYILKKIPLSEAQAACYNDMRTQLLAEYDGHLSTAKNKLVVNLRLQQISSGFIVGQQYDNLDKIELTDDYDVLPNEVVWLDDVNPKLNQMLRDIDELDKPILIITRFSAEAAKIYDLLKDRYETCLITGWKTIGSIAKFKSGEFQIMVANIAKIARGHNLQCAHTTIFYSNTFSMELRQQSEFRTFRIGQNFPCTYIDYSACKVDDTVLESLKLKKNLLEFIRNKDLKEVI